MAQIPSLQSLRHDLRATYTSIRAYEPNIALIPVLDDRDYACTSSTSLCNGDVCTQLEKAQNSISGFAKFREAVRRDLEVLERVLRADSGSGLESQPQISTNASYLIALWNEVLSAPPPVIGICKHFPVPNDLISDVEMSSLSSGGTIQVESDVLDKRRGRATTLKEGDIGVKVDVVADGGRKWIRVNTIKPSRFLADLTELDSYLTDSSSSEHDACDPYSASSSKRALPRTDSHNTNSILRMAQSLIHAARSSPISVPGTNTKRIPKVILRLTRLQPPSRLKSSRKPGSLDDNDETNEPDESLDAEISQTIEQIRHMGVDVYFGSPNTPPPALPNATQHKLRPTSRINLDLSVLIALVSDLTHSPLPNSTDDALCRFAKKGKSDPKSTAKQADNDEAGAGGRALANQLIREMNKGLLDGMYHYLSPYISALSSDSTSPRVEFWTTREAMDRFFEIVDTIGGEKEKRRANALFFDTSTTRSASRCSSYHTPSLSRTISNSGDLLPESSVSPCLCTSCPSTSQEEAERLFWSDSRYPIGYLPFVPIKLFETDTRKRERKDMEDRTWLLHPFFDILVAICRDILEDISSSCPPALSNPSSISSNIDSEHKTAPTQKPKSKAKSKLTPHTLDSLKSGAERGWTTLTANRGSVDTVMREVKERYGLWIGGERQERREEEAAAVWVVTPRSLAEGARW